MQPSPELRNVLHALYIAMSSGNAAFVEAFYSLAAGAAFIGTDHAEFWTDSGQHNEDVRHFFDGTEGTVAWRAGAEPIAMVEGSTGWTIDRPVLRFPDGTTLRLRLSLVWHREGESWKVVHSHASVGAGAG